ncbi:hypothetical protein F4814DRAFT_399191 [Daldinia grandis]|nr:hypothetical protein F4814DRAFT_399191 [Daldinia grandis]
MSGPGSGSGSGQDPRNPFNNPYHVPYNPFQPENPFRPPDPNQKNPFVVNLPPDPFLPDNPPPNRNPFTTNTPPAIQNPSLTNNPPQPHNPFAPPNPSSNPFQPNNLPPIDHRSNRDQDPFPTPHPAPYQYTVPASVLYQPPIPNSNPTPYTLPYPPQFPPPQFPPPNFIPPLHQLTLTKQPPPSQNRTIHSTLPLTRPHFYHLDVLRSEPIRADPTRPATPLARKHGISAIPFHRLYRPDGRAHSGLTPEFPSTVPPELSDPVPKPTPEELNRIFRTEREQIQWSNPCVKTWRLGALNDGLVGGWPSAEDRLKSNWDQWEVFKTNLSIVDESRWLSCFRRDHWFDSRHNVLNALSEPIPGLNMWPDETWYTVDNPIIWQYTSHAIEIFCRVIRLLCEEQNEWLDALLFTPLIPIGYNPNYQFPDEHKPFKLKFIPRPREQRASGAQLFQAIENLTKGNIINMFCDETTLAHPAQAVTTSFAQSIMGKATIMFNVPFSLRTLLEMETSVPERCIQLFNFSSLLLHEFMHAMWMCRFDSTLSPGDEPFYRDEWIAELGHSFTGQVWGGSVHPGPARQYIRGRHRGFASSIQLETFPSLTYAARERDYDKNTFEGFRSGGLYNYHFLVPAVWASAIICEEFWTKIIPQRGSVALRAPLLFGMTTVNAGLYESRRIINPEFWTPELRGDFESAVTRWVDAGAHIRLVRKDWYEEEYNKWKWLPWSNSWFISMIEQFTYHHANRNLASCRELAAQTVRSTRPSKGGLPNSSTGLSYLIGLLMLLSLPREPSGELLRPQVPRQAFFYPSRAAEPWFNTLGLGSRVGPYNVLTSVPPDIVKGMKGFADYASNIKHIIHILAYVEFEIGAPLGWIASIIDCFISLHVQRDSNPRLDTWGTFSFKVPPYDPGWVIARESKQSLAIPIQLRFKAVIPWHNAALPQPLYSAPSSPHTLPKQWGGADFRRPPKYEAENKPIKREYPQHLYIGDVANHRALGDAWVVESDRDDGFDVFNITGELKSVGATETDYGAMVVIGPHGPELNQDARAEVFRAKLHTSIHPIGKLMLRRRIEEVAECDGRNGRPAWTSWGPLIFDITHFPARSVEEQEALTESSGGPLSKDLARSEHEISQLLQRLTPYTCAYLHVAQPVRNMRHFTLEMLRWYDNPSHGVYIALGNAVYDISDYLRFHPGGSQLFIHCSGLDATQQFLQYHNTEIMNSYGFMQVGYLVPECTWEQLKDNHVVVHDWVFNISSLQQGDPNLFNCLHKFICQDTSIAITGHDSDAAALLTLFIDKKYLIVAGLATKELLDIPVWEFHRHSNYEGVQGAWVAVEGYVYNVGDLMKYPDYYDHKLGFNWAGKELANPPLAQWLTTNYRARCIGRLVEGPIMPEPEIEPDLALEDLDPPRGTVDLIIEGREGVNE